MQAPARSRDDIERFRIRSLPEILALVREIRDARALVTVHFGEGPRFIVTSLLACDPQSGRMILDCGADAGETQALLGAGRFTVETFLRQIKVQFAGQSVASTQFEGAPALSLPLPAEMLRFQRRDYFRCVAISHPPLLCRFSTPAGEPREAARVLNIGCGGIGIVCPPDRRAPEIGTRFENCAIELPGVATIVADLEVRNLAEVKLATGAKQIRCGCEFVDLPGTDETCIQRYINIIERSRVAK